MARRRLLFGGLMLLIALLAGAQTYSRASAGSPGGARSLSNLHVGGETEQRDTGRRTAALPGFTPSPAPSRSATAPSPAAPSNLQEIADSGFEDGTGTLAWHQSSSAGLALIDQFFPHTGTWNGDLCGYQGCNPDVLWQQFTVPSGIYAATL